MLVRVYNRKLRRLSLESSHNGRDEHITGPYTAGVRSLGVNRWVEIETSRALAPWPMAAGRVGAEGGRILRSGNTLGKCFESETSVRAFLPHTKVVQETHQQMR